MVGNAQMLCRTGAATVRDAGSRGNSIFFLKGAIQKSEIEGPNLIACGEALIITGGHFFFWDMNRIA